MDAQTALPMAVSIGVLSALSLPMGAAVGLVLRPAPARAATLAGFGAGALLTAVAIELVAPVLAGHDGPRGLGFAVLSAGALVGGLLFVALERLLDARGAFLRKSATAIRWLGRRRHAREKALVRDLCAIPLLWRLPAPQVELMVRDVRERSLAPGEGLFEEGAPAEALYFVRSGELELLRGGDRVEILGPGDACGELGLVTGERLAVGARAVGEASVLELRRSDFERWRRECPELDQGVREIAAERLLEVRRHEEAISDREREWADRAVRALRQGGEVPTLAEMRAAAEAHPGAPLAIWLGMLLDGVPESLALGAGFFAVSAARAAAGEPLVFVEAIPWTLFAGLFLSNFPEALSSSLGMSRQGYGHARILALWSALVVTTGIGAGLGYGLGGALPHLALIAIEGVAAGAMLTVVASTMIPEAVHLAGSGARAGLATLVGFFSAAAFGLLE